MSTICRYLPDTIEQHLSVAETPQKMFGSEMPIVFIRNHFCYGAGYAIEDYFVSGCEFILISLLHSPTYSELVSCVDAVGGMYMEDVFHSLLDI